jgi:hypothetical protein
MVDALERIEVAILGELMRGGDRGRRMTAVEFVTTGNPAFPDEQTVTEALDSLARKGRLDITTSQGGPTSYGLPLR